MGTSGPSAQSAGSLSAVQTRSESDFARYFTSMPLGSQRWSGGHVASASRPIAASRPLQAAMACTVPMWFLVDRRSGTTTSPWWGAMSTTRRCALAKYGAARVKKAPNTARPFGRAESLRYIA